MEIKIAFFEKNKQLNIDVILSIFFNLKQKSVLSRSKQQNLWMFFSRFVDSKFGV